MNKLQENAMLVSLSISRWDATKLDREASKKTEDLYSAEHGTVRSSKILIGKEYLAKIRAITGLMRTNHYKMTLAWEHKGADLLPNRIFQDYLTAMNDMHRELEVAITEFTDVYPELRELARVRLNGMFDEKDFPPVEEIRNKFKVSWAFFPVPAGEDFRCQIAEDQAKEIRDKIEATVQAASVTALQDLWKRLYAAVGHMKEKLTDADSIFRDTLVENIRELTALLPKLNILDDPDLETMRCEVERELTRFDAQDLRGDKEARTETAKKADEILSKIAAFIS